MQFICPNCGKDVGQGGRFCPGCGILLPQFQPPAPVPSSSTAPVYRPPETVKKKSSAPIIIAAVVTILLAVTVLALLLILPNLNKEAPKSTEPPAVLADSFSNGVIDSSGDYYNAYFGLRFHCPSGYYCLDSEAIAEALGYLSDAVDQEYNDDGTASSIVNQASYDLMVLSDFGGTVNITYVLDIGDFYELKEYVEFCNRTTVPLLESYGYIVDVTDGPVDFHGDTAYHFNGSANLSTGSVEQDVYIMMRNGAIVIVTIAYPLGQENIGQVLYNGFSLD